MGVSANACSDGWMDGKVAVHWVPMRSSQLEMLLAGMRCCALALAVGAATAERLQLHGCWQAGDPGVSPRYHLPRLLVWCFGANC